MIFHPQLEIEETVRDMQEQFGGYNHNLRIPETDFYDMKNMTGDYYPALSPRKRRGFLKTLSNFSSMICKGVLCYISNGRLYLNDSEVQAFATTTTSQLDENYTEHVMVSMGAYLLVFRRHKDNGLVNGWYVNTKDRNDKGYIDKIEEYNYPQAEVLELTFTTCGADGAAYVISHTGSNPPTGTIANGTIWLDTSGEQHYLKKWSSTQSLWVTISTTYVKISRAQISADFKVGDGIEISALADDGTMSPSLVKQFEALNSSNIIVSAGTDEQSGNDWIVVTGMLDREVSHYRGKCRIARVAPYMDYVCESGNRLWGCRYGFNRKNDIVNEIYASKQGDFKNWFCYAGLSTDSYAASVGSEELWTGCIPYGQYILFFKENCIHKLYGTMPSNYQLTEQKVRGVQKGSEKSLCIVNETLFYKSISDVCYYDGSLPTGISAALGEQDYKNAVCASIKSKLYINMQDSADKWHLFVYDMSTGTWHKEDNIHCKAMCRVDNDLYFVDEYNNLGTFTGKGTPESDVKWHTITGDIGYSIADNKYIGKMSIRLKKPITSRVSVFIQYDNESSWNTVATIEGQGVNSITVPIIPRRCDHFKLRFEGVGDCKILSLAKTIEVGSDI